MIYDLRFRKFRLLIIVLFAAVFLAASCNRQPPAENSETNIVQQIHVIHKVEGVDIGDQLFVFYESEHKSALDLLKSGHTVETKNFSGVGEFVESINAVKADGKKEFWALYVNNQQSQVGASDYFPKHKDIIVWKLEKIK